ncbi:MAG: heparinase II/III family protein [Sulfuricaulis sp.]
MIRHMPADEYEFHFLNQSRTFQDGNIDWACACMSKLWRYNLHYFDYVIDPGRSAESVGKLISSWIKHNPPRTEDAWEPYTVSLRIVNWIKYFLMSEIPARVPDLWLDSLYQQALWLECNIEYHILANHYLKNGKALYFAGVFFEGRDAQRWLEKGLDILSNESDEQILSDGGHYERSPMYHSIVVEDYLDILNLILSGSINVDSSVVDHLRVKTQSALEYLDQICMPDGDIPLFNDSAFHVANPPAAIFGYARRLVDYSRQSFQKRLSVIEKPGSGYYIIRNDTDMIIVDCGMVGPDYQPGHAHCDTLSYELAIDGRRVIVDSGVHDYEKGAYREYARCTRAHNTVSVDGYEQSEVWGLFRVGRRARPISASAFRIDGKRARFVGSHDGFRHLPGSVVHSRTVDYDVQGGWTVEDNLSGSGQHRMESFIHLHPDLNANVIEDKILLSDASGKLIATIEVSGGGDIKLTKGWYFPEFGKKMDNAMITIRKSGVLPLRIQYKIRKASAA